jgi:hypothetical protein
MLFAHLHPLTGNAPFGFFAVNLWPLSLPQFSRPQED